MQRLRDNPACADQEFNDILDISNPGLSYHLKFDPAQKIMPFFSKFPSLLSLNNKPRVAILREEGTNGQSEMAFAFMTVSLPLVMQINSVLRYHRNMLTPASFKAGFTAIDVHMTDLISGSTSLADFVGLACCG